MSEWKILRAILHKKIYPQNPSPKSSTKKYLENKQKLKSAEEDGIDEKADERSKWVKTDSECKFGLVCIRIYHLYWYDLDD